MHRPGPAPPADLRQQIRVLQRQATAPGVDRREWMALHGRLVALKRRVDLADSIAALQALAPDRPDDQGLRNRLAALLSERDRLEAQR